jgi:tetratricopeptide (TPR) repeat protein
VTRHFAAALAVASLNFLVAQPRDPNADLESILSLASKAESVGDYARAGQEYQQALKMRPELGILHQRLGLTYHLRNRFAEAIPEFQRAIQLDPNLWGSSLFLGIDYYKTNQFDKAVPALQRAIELDRAQSEAEARFWLGASYAASGRREDAIREYQRASEIRPKDVEALFQLARVYQDQASSAFERLGKIEPNAAAVSLLQAERLFAENRTDLARIEYERAIRLRPDYRGTLPQLEQMPPHALSGNIEVNEQDARASIGLAALWRSRGEKAKASEQLANLATLAPGDGQARKYVTEAQTPADQVLESDNTEVYARVLNARAFVSSGDFGRAAESIRQGLLREPDNIDVLLLSGEIYQRLAAQLLDRMVGIDADSYRVHQLTGEIYEQKGAYEQAIQSYRRALSQNADAPGVYYALGNVYWKMRQFDQAEQWLREELKRNPHHELARYRLGSLQTERGNSLDAIENLREAVRAHPEWTGARLDLGRALLQSGRYEEAVKELKKVASQDPENDRVHFVLSNAYRKMARNDLAQSEIAQYQALTRKRLERAQKAVREVSDAVESKP